ncbi:MAG TPA: tripartite tricarboxylate transporter substrate binding protein [Burkholderiales bacterium]|nr:tripartite tricarboxylate transporter substrate binding protein [Burkholderiales bacterium]
MPAISAIKASAGALACGVLVWWSGGHAEPFPSAPVRIIVPYPISGPTDVRGTSRVTKTYKLIAEAAPPAISDALARIAADAIRADTTYPVHLRREPGAATTRGATHVARARPDGHTLLFASNATIVIGPQYFYSVAYRPLHDFELVAPLATMPFVLMANATLPVGRVQQLIAWLKVRPGEINYGSSGDGSTGHLAGELFRRLTGLDVVHVSYNGGLAALNGLATNQVSFMFAALPLALPYLGNQYIRPIAVTTARRLEWLPDLPTIAEAGVSGYEAEGWYAIFAPARTSRLALAWLHEHIAAAMSDAETQQRLRALGLEPADSSRERFATRINSEMDDWAPLVRASRIPLRDSPS